MGNKILPLQLDKHASDVYEKKFSEEGVALKLGVKAEKLLLDENNNPKALLLNTGEEVPCELVIVATGVRSNVAFMENDATIRMFKLNTAQCAEKILFSSGMG